MPLQSLYAVLGTQHAILHTERSFPFSMPTIDTAPKRPVGRPRKRLDETIARLHGETNCAQDLERKLVLLPTSEPRAEPHELTEAEKFVLAFLMTACRTERGRGREIMRRFTAWAKRELAEGRVPL